MQCILYKETAYKIDLCAWVKFGNAINYLLYETSYRSLLEQGMGNNIELVKDQQSGLYSTHDPHKKHY